MVYSTLDIFTTRILTQYDLNPQGIKLAVELEGSPKPPADILAAALTQLSSLHLYL